jgi:hypothetical protein
MIYYKVFNTKNQIVQVAEYWQEVLDFIGEGLKRSDLRPCDKQRFFGEYRIVTCHREKDLYFKVCNLTGQLLLVTPKWETAIECLQENIQYFTNDIYEYITDTEKTLIKIVQL